MFATRNIMWRQLGREQALSSRSIELLPDQTLSEISKDIKKIKTPLFHHKRKVLHENPSSITHSMICPNWKEDKRKKRSLKLYPWRYRSNYFFKKLFLAKQKFVWSAIKTILYFDIESVYSWFFRVCNDTNLALPVAVTPPIWKSFVTTTPKLK